MNSWPIVYDGAEYAAMGSSLVTNGEFVRPYEDGVVYYRHYAPLYPTYLAVFYAVFGFSVAVTKIANLVLSILFVAVVYLTTKDLLGSTKAWYAAAFVALEPMFLITTAIGYSESLVGLLFVGTVWAVVRGLREPQFLPLAGALAGLGFVSKASIGYVILIAGAAGLAWRMKHGGLKSLTNAWYVAGVSAFLLIAGGWSYRNLVRYGWPNWETSAYVTSAYGHGFSNLGLLLSGLGGKAPWFIMLFLFYGGVFMPELRRSMSRLREHETSAIWLAVCLVFVIGWVVSSFFWTVEQTPIWWHDNLRYVVISSPVLLWLALREATILQKHGTESHVPLRSFRTRFCVIVVIFVMVSMAFVAFPAPYAHVAAVTGLLSYVAPGDVVAVHGMPVETVYTYIATVGAVAVRYFEGFRGNFVLSVTPSEYSGFRLVNRFIGEDLTGQAYTCFLWANATGDGSEALPSSLRNASP